MVTSSQIGWGSYSVYSGPYFKGTIKFQVPDNPTENQRRLAVVCQTEGAAYDAVNMYDKCVISIGLIQWCEANYYLTSKLLGAICDKLGHSAVASALKPSLDLCNAEFKQNANKQWRFFFKDGRGEVDTLKKQQELFLGSMTVAGQQVPNDGKPDSWTEASKFRAKLWAASMANVWLDKRARDIQDEYTAQRLTSFVLIGSKKLLWDGTPDDGWNGALRAAFLSFAANNPQKASEQMILAATQSKFPKWSPEWCINAIKQMTFGPNISIYKERYDKIRPWLESLWKDVDLPKDHKALKEWSEPKKQPESLAPVVIPVQPVEEKPVIVAIEQEVKRDVVEEIDVTESDIIDVRPKDITNVTVPTSVVITTNSTPPKFRGGLIEFIINLLTTIFRKK